MCVNEECVGARMIELSPPVILNLGLNLRSALYLVIKVRLKLSWKIHFSSYEKPSHDAYLQTRATAAFILG